MLRLHGGVRPVKIAKQPCMNVSLSAAGDLRGHGLLGQRLEAELPRGCHEARDDRGVGLIGSGVGVGLGLIALSCLPPE
jgi:hypothetical protein